MAGKDKAPKPEQPVPPTVVDIKPPKNAQELADLLLEGVARAIKCAGSSKEWTDAVKAGESLYKTLYGEKDVDDTGSAFATQGRGTNGHRG